MSNTSDSAEDPGLIGTHRWELVSSGSTIDLVPVRSRLTPLAVSIVAVLLAGAMKLAGAAMLWALSAAVVVVAIGLIGLWANRLAEAKARRIRFNGLRRHVEIGEEIRSFDSFHSIGIDRVMMSPINAPKKKIQRAILTLRARDSSPSLPLIRGNLLQEPKMDEASEEISALAGIPVVNQRTVDPSTIRSGTILVALMCAPLITALIAEFAMIKEHRDRLRLKERAVFAEATVVSDQTINGPNRRGPFRTLKLQPDDRMGQLTTRRWEPYHPGDKVTVFYDPSRPNNLTMDDSRHSLPAQAFLLTGPLAAAAFVTYLMTKAIQMLRIAGRT